MKVNHKKAKDQSFNFSMNFRYLPQITHENEPLEVVNSTRLLGVVFQSNCKWDDHVKTMIQKANQKMWSLRRLKSQGASRATLIELYKLMIRQGLEFAAPLWTFGLSQKNKSDLERIQSKVTNLIIGENQLSYPERLNELNLDFLEDRRISLARSCSDKMVRDKRFQFLFPKKQYKSTRSKDKYIIPLCRTNCLKNSSILKFIEYQNKKQQQA